MFAIIALFTFAVFVLICLFAAESINAANQPNVGGLEMYDEICASLDRRLAADERKRAVIDEMRRINQEWKEN